MTAFNLQHLYVCMYVCMYVCKPNTPYCLPPILVADYSGCRRINVGRRFHSPCIKSYVADAIQRADFDA